MQLTRRSLMFYGLGSALAHGILFNEPVVPLDCSPCDHTVSCFTPLKFGEHRVYVAGEGPPILLMHELPGLTPDDLKLAKRLVKQGYTVLVPLLFGNPGDDRFLHFYNKICGKDEFNCGGSGKTPDAAKWLLDFSYTIRDTWKEGLGIGVIGMCLTGEFPLVLLQNQQVKAAVLCQPTDPFNLLTLVRLGPGSKLSLKDSDIENAGKSEIPILGMRYSEDLFCPEQRFKTLDDKLKHFYRLELKTMKGMSHHSSLGMDYCQAAFDEVCRYLHQQLKGPSDDYKFPHLSKSKGETSAPAECGADALNCAL